jgi:glycerol-3-phosphate dehydrogenase (NAD(P)+)
MGQTLKMWVVLMRLTVLGAGSWGLTLAWLYARAGHQVTVWDRNPDKLARLQAQPSLTQPIRVCLPPDLIYQPGLAEAVEDAEIVLLAVTTTGTSPVAMAMAPYLHAQTAIINVSKGIEQPSLTRLYARLTTLLPQSPVAVLSGPTLAQEMLNGLPTACVLASPSEALCERLQPLLSISKQFRIYSNTDVVGVELGGALKNIFAIASGYMATRGLGDNARAALITRGLHEMTQFAVSQGAEEATLYGLSGLGDLMATCSSPLSRNYQVGAGLAQGHTLQQVLDSLGTVAEGVGTTRAVNMLARQNGLDMPITGVIAQALDGQLTQEDFINQLMSRRLRAEV